jgi:hypothetical protein
VSNAVPEDAEIEQAVHALFAATSNLDRVARWNALVPTDSGVPVQPPPGQKQVTYVPVCESRELVDFILDIDEMTSAAGFDTARATRLFLVGYCHVMESEFTPTLIWNQLRLLNGLTPSWHYTRLTPKGKVVPCEYPWEKFAEILRLSTNAGQPIGGVVQALWDRRLRNAYSHSRYWLGSSFVILSGELSPISRKGTFGSGASYSLPDLRERYRGARTLLFEVARAHATACEAFSK